MSVPPTLLFAVTFPANTGFAWDFIERSYGRVADALSPYGIRTLVAYPSIPAPPATLEGTSAVAVVLDLSFRGSAGRRDARCFIARENVQAVYLTDREAWSIWYPMLRRAGARKVVMHDHTSGARTRPTGMRRLAKRGLVSVPGLAADVVVAVSEYVARRHREVSLLPKERVRRVWNGVDVPLKGPTAPSVHEILGLDPGVPVVAAACRATPDKGVDVLFDAFEQVSAGWGDESQAPVLAYVGNGPDLDRLAAKRASLRAAHRIHLLGYLPGAADVLRSAQLCVVPSVWQDAFPLSVLESMVRGRAVIASSVGGVPEMIEHGVSGLLVPARDSGALASAILRVLGDDELRASLGSAAQRRALRYFPAAGQTIGMIEAVAEVLPGADAALVGLRRRLDATGSGAF